MKKTTILFCFVLFFYRSFAQEANVGYGAEKYKEYLSPQAGSMLRFDRVEPISNGGAPIVKVPLYSCDDPDFDISGTLQYSSGGFKPSENDNFVGRDWTLQQGGVIWREVKGMPDDFTLHTDFYGQDGFLAHVKNPTFDDARTRSRLLESPLSNTTNNVLGEALGDLTRVHADDRTREVNSDIYHFRFGPHAGKFMINFDGTVNVVSYTGHKYEVNLSNYKQIVENRLNNFDSSITIKTDDGYSYRFGGNLGALEYTICSWTKFFEYPSATSEAEILFSAMHLTEVVSANGRRLRYNYMNNVEPRFTQQRIEMLTGANYPMLKAKNAHLNCVFNIRPYHDDQSPYTPVLSSQNGRLLFLREYNPRGITGTYVQKNFTLNKTALIESIETENNRIEFVYEQRREPNIDESLVLGVSPFPCECGASLRTVTVYGQSDSGWSRLETCNLDYEYSDGRMFLKKAANYHEGTYSFNYNFQHAPTFTTNIDHWGFLNRGDNSSGYSTLIPAQVASDSQDQIIASDLRDPNPALSSANMLGKVTFPAGGFATYEYEPHTYSSSITQIRSNAFRKKLEPNKNGNEIAGGARLKKVTFYDTDYRKAKEVSYRYTRGIEDTLSSGILMHFPRYVHHEEVICIVQSGLVTPPPMPMVYVNGDGINLSPSGSHVQYSRIFEISEEETPLRNSVCKETVYSDYQTNPDGLGENNFYYAYPFSAPLEQMIIPSRDYDYFCWMRAEMEDMSHERGKILREIYHAGADVEKKIEYRYDRRGADRYNVLISSPALYNTGFHFILRAVRVPMCSYHRVGKVITENRHGTSSVQTEEYEIDEDGYLKSVAICTSKGDRKKTVYKYRKDTPSLPGMDGLLIEKSEWLNASGVEKMLSRQCYGYSSYGKISRVDTYSAQDVPVDWMHHVYTDGYGNPVLVSRNGEEQEIIVWGCNGSRPVAIIENAEYDAVKRILGHYRILNNPRDYYSKITYEELENLRMQLPEAHVTTIRYDSRLQPVSVIDPAGIETRYEYQGNKLAKKSIMEGYRQTIMEYYQYNHNVNR